MILSRILAVVVGGYFLTTGVITLVALLLVIALDFARSEAMLLSAMAGFPLYATIILWGWSRPALGRLWLLLGVATLACHSVAYIVVRLEPDSLAVADHDSTPGLADLAADGEMTV